MRIARALVVFVALAIPSGAVADTSSAAKYQDYYGAVQALKRGDCRRAVDHLNAFLREHSYVREKYPYFYLDIRLVIGQCNEKIHVRGIEGESRGIEPLPDHPPLDD